MLLRIAFLLALPVSVFAQRFDSTFAYNGPGFVFNSSAVTVDYSEKILSFHAPDGSTLNDSEYGAYIDLSTKTWHSNSFNASYGSYLRYDTLAYTFGRNNSYSYFGYGNWTLGGNVQWDYFLTDDNEEYSYRPILKVLAGHLVFIPDLDAMVLYGDTLGPLDTLHHFRPWEGLSLQTAIDPVSNLTVLISPSYARDSLSTHFVNQSGQFLQRHAISLAALVPANKKIVNTSFGHEFYAQNGKIYASIPLGIDSITVSEFKVIEFNVDLSLTGQVWTIPVGHYLPAYQRYLFKFSVNQSGDLGFGVSSAYGEALSTDTTHAYIGVLNPTGSLLWGKSLGPKPGENGVDLNAVYVEGDSLWVFVARARTGGDHRTNFPRVIELEASEYLSQEDYLEFLRPFPNPTTDHVKLNKASRIEVMDVNGKTLWIEEKSTEVSLGHLPKGVYFLKINTSKAVPIILH